MYVGYWVETWRAYGDLTIRTSRFQAAADIRARSRVFLPRLSLSGRKDCLLSIKGGGSGVGWFSNSETLLEISSGLKTVAQKERWGCTVRFLPARATRTAHSPGKTPVISPAKLTDRHTATGFPVAFITSVAHSACSTYRNSCRKRSRIFLDSICKPDIMISKSPRFRT